MKAGLRGVLISGLLGSLFTIGAVSAHEKQRPRGPVLADVNKIMVSIERELQEEGFVVVDTRREADAELLLTGGHVTTLEGSARNIGDVLLNYAVELRDIETGRRLFTYIDDQSEGSGAEACEDMAEDVAEELEDAKSDSVDEWYD